MPDAMPKSPETAADDVTMLYALELPVVDDPFVLSRGVELAIELKQHLFDTYYHAVALETPHIVLITADEPYLRAAREKGRIMHISEWRPRMTVCCDRHRLPWTDRPARGAIARAGSSRSR